MATLFSVPQFFDNNGNPLSAGHLYWCQAGTTTAKQTWKNEDESTPHVLAYITLDGNGRAPGGAIFIRGSYKLEVKNSDESITYYTIDNINEYNSYDFTGLTASAADLNSTTTSSKDISGVAPLVYTILLADRGKTLLVNAITANAAIYLPSAVTVGNTFKIWIKKVDKSVNTVTITPFGAQVIDGAPNKVLFDYNDFIEVRSDGSNWVLGGSLIRGTISTASIATTIALADNGRIFNCNASAGGFTVTLPACATVGRGFWVGFKKIDNSVNHVTLQAAGAETIDGSNTYFINAQWQFTIIKTDGVNWFVMEESHSSSEAITGDIKLSYQYIQNGWVYVNDDGTIGDASSGSTIRANADTRALFTLIWTVVPIGFCPIYNADGSLGARTTAAGDFNAHKRLSLPKIRGRSFISVGTCGLGNIYSLGQSLGEEMHQLTKDELASHDHQYKLYIPHVGETADGGGTMWPITLTTPQSSSEGKDHPHNTLHPISAVFVLIKL
ncbi:MAG: hypothetical protein WC495_03750 [Patescibacteria group bacterium]